MGVKLKNYFLVLVSAFTLLITFDTVWLLASFLSYHPLRTKQYPVCQESVGDFFSSNISVNAILKDVLLLVLFILQHTLMARINMQWLLDKIGFGVLTRSIYVIASCVSLQAMIHFWQPTNYSCLWNVSTDEWRGSLTCITMAVLHVISWFMVYGGCLLVDVGELIGAKQVLYYIRGFPNPLRNKSEDLVRYYKHMRHPSFIGFVLILWGIPQMSLDRAFLAIQLTLYMLVAWHTDARDVSYIRSQLADKEASVTNGDWHRRSFSRKRDD